MKDEIRQELAEREIRGEKKGENRLADLNNELFKLGRINDVRRASCDQNFRRQLYKEFNMN
jgi:hypothetical protein